ncbi:PREDICTED: cholinesterase-like [Nicrophorus vespilloides]|uniref:Carboxylic ester hydrolase n=1 Tax=Nicrophorus vespilloides TaxID=110193 RepID=A0ABM1MN09_NICVS|nr:PREDICTED: cholinesterase-like [Nicrophorus vespilloides]
MQNLNNEDFFAFMSIPYAKPPVGTLRFKGLEPADNWEGIRDATDSPTPCSQNAFGMIVGEEDCMFLNVYTRNTNPKELKSVMVYMHEGSFCLGSSNINTLGPYNLMIEDIVLVTFNYRLGVLGFMNLEGSDIEVNSGLKDQTFALKWVQKNIHKFGGDKNSVTIFGNSAGAASVSLHLFSPMSVGLFHKAISMSGNAMVPWLMGVKNSGLEVAKNLGITSEDPIIIADELRKIPYQEFINVQEELNWYGQNDVEWNGGIIIEDTGESRFLTANPLEEGFVSKVPYMIGFNDLDGDIMELFENIFGSPHDFSLQSDMPRTLVQGDKAILMDVIDEVRKEYFNGTLPDRYDYNFMEMAKDITFKYPTIQLVKKYGNVQSTYLYEFRADTTLNLYKHFLIGQGIYKGAGHSDDLGYIFNNVLTPDIVLNSIEHKIVTKFVKLWTNFAKYGNPIPDAPTPALDNVVWKPANSKEMNYLIIDNDELKVDVLDLKSANFWDGLYKKYNRKY